MNPALPIAIERRFQCAGAVAGARSVLNLWTSLTRKTLLMHLCARIGYAPPEAFQI